VQFEEFTAYIVDSGRHLLQLINDVLDLSKVQAGKLAFHPAPLDLALLVEEVTGILAPLALRGGVVCSIDVEPGLDRLVLDPLRLKQALYNYLSNAIKFSAEGGRVNIRARLQGEACFRLEVEDTGIGIAPADQARLFENFVQLDSGSNKQYPGAGLGLALTRRLVEAQGGSVGVQSAPGVGSVFHLVLPRVAAV
jgi:signal transduction histidine kinase